MDSTILLNSLEAGDDLDFFPLLCKSFPLKVHVLDALCNVHYLVPGLNLVLPVVIEVVNDLVHRKLGLEVPHNLLDVLEANDNLRNERNPVGIQSPIEDVDVARVCPSIRSTSGICHCAEQFDKEGEALDDAEDGNEIHERQVVDEMNAALNEILMKRVYRQDGQDVLCFLDKNCPSGEMKLVIPIPFWFSLSF